MREYERIEQKYEDDNLPPPDNWRAIGLCQMSLVCAAPCDCMIVSGTADRAVAGRWTDWRPDSDWLIQALQPACRLFFFSSTRLSLAYRGRPFR